MVLNNSSIVFRGEGLVNTQTLYTLNVLVCHICHLHFHPLPSPCTLHKQAENFNISLLHLPSAPLTIKKHA